MFEPFVWLPLAAWLTARERLLSERTTQHSLNAISIQAKWCDDDDYDEVDLRLAGCWHRALQPKPARTHKHTHIGGVGGRASSTAQQQQQQPEPAAQQCNAETR